LTLESLRHNPLEDLPLPLTSDFRVIAAPFALRFVLRGEAAALAPLEAAFGVAPPAAPLSSASAGSRSALWLGPDEWLLLAEDDGQGLEESIGAALEGVFHSLVDVSHRQAAVTLEGARAQEALGFGVALDLDPPAFPVRMVARTMFVKAEITLWRRGERVWRIEFARSFANYVRELLLEAARGF
jgi:sarcosine oxidase subunit gamma